MLDQTERYRILKYFRFLSTAAFLPFEVDVSSWKIHPRLRASWKRLLWQMSFAIFCLHSLCQLLSLLHVLIFLRSTPLHQIIIHMTLACGYATTAFFNYLLYLKYPGINAAIARMTLTGSVDGGKYCCCDYSTICYEVQPLIVPQRTCFY